MSKKEEREAAIIDVLADVGGEVVDPIPIDTKDSVTSTAVLSGAYLTSRACVHEVTSRQTTDIKGSW
jgi:hypothetical protein